MTTSGDDPHQNRILAALTPSERARIEIALEWVELQAGQVLWEAGDHLSHVYFPCSTSISQLYTSADGFEVELALTGPEGVADVSSVLGRDAALYRAVASSSGLAARLHTDEMRWEFDRGTCLQRVCLPYAKVAMTQMVLVSLCSRAHSVEQQLCRWLLVALQRLSDSRICRTHDELAGLIGVRRARISEAAGRLQAAGIIRYRRGQITVLDRAALEARACDCYQAFMREEASLGAEPRASLARPAGSFRANPEILRQRAEAQWRMMPESAHIRIEDAERLVSELEVQKIECEIQIDELRQAYQEADAMRDRYTDLYDFAPVGFLTLDPQARIVDINLAGAILLGIRRSQRARYHFDAMLEDDFVAPFRRFVAAVLGGRSRQVCEATLRPTPQRASAEVRIEAVSDDEGKECRMVVIDLSAERRAERALREQADHRRALLDNFPFMVWMKDTHSRFLAVNESFARNYGYATANELEGKTDFDTADRALAEAYRAEDQRVLESGVTRQVEEPIETAGELRWYETYKSPLKVNGQIAGTVGFARDITQRHLAEQAIEDSERRYRGLIDKLPVGVLIIQEQALNLVNPKAEALFGFVSGASIETSLLSRVHQADRHRVAGHCLPQTLDAASQQTQDVRIFARGGKLLDCWMQFSVVDWRGKPAVMATIEDVTHQKRIEAELRSMATMDFLTGLATRRHFMERMQEAHSRLQREVDQSLTLLVLDLDHFKEINDRFGHATGDAMLRQVSAVLRGELRKADVAGRLGGEEFAILLPGTDLPTASAFSERLRARIAESSVVVEDRNISVTVSIGAAPMLGSDPHAEHALRRADQALYRAKASGRNRIALSRQSSAGADAGNDWSSQAADS